MKLLQIVPAVFLSAALCVSCNDEQDKNENANTTATTETTTTVTRKAGEGKKTVIKVEEVPAPVITTFNTKADKAEEIEWLAYDPIPEDNWDTTRDYYFVKYRINHVPWEAWFSPEGEFIRSEPIIFLANSGPLPTEVVRSIMENYPGYEIVEVDKENDKDKDMFEVELKKGEEKMRVKFLPDGTIYKAK